MLVAFQEFQIKLLKCVDGAAISTFLVLLGAGVFPATFVLDLNDSESVM